jgi:adenosylhomocysteine nucleosidase
MSRLPVLHDIAGRRTLFLLAAEPEYGPELRKIITPVITGVGPVEAAISAARSLAELTAAGKAPDLVVSLGSAGSNTLEQGAVYQIASVSYRDMDASPLGFEKGRTPFLDLPAELPLPIRLPDIPAVRLSSGANIVSGATYSTIDADMVEMETFSILRACHPYGIPLIGLRGVSDGATELQHYDDWAGLLGHIDAELAAIISRLPDLLGRAEIRY